MTRPKGAQTEPDGVAMLSLESHLKPYSHVIWDMNGTLVDDAHICVEAVNPLLTEYGLPLIDVEIYRQFFRFPVWDYYCDLGFRISPEEFDQLSHRFHDRYHALLPTATLFDGTDELLTSLKQQNKKLSILTAARTDDLHAVIQHFGIQTHFDHLFGLSHRAADSKIARGRELMAESKVSTQETVMIGDTLHDLEVGEALGIEVILVTGGHMSEERLSRHPSDPAKKTRVHRRSF